MMRSIRSTALFNFTIAATMLLANPAAAQMQEIERLPVPDYQMQFDAMPTGQLVTLIMRDVVRVPYVIAPDVLRDRDPVSVNLRFPREQLPDRVMDFFRSIGLTVNVVDGTAFVSRADFGAGETKPTPPVGGFPYNPREPEERITGDIAVIRTAHMSPNDLAEIINSVIPTVTVAAREQSAPQDGRIVDRLEPPHLVVRGEPEDLILVRSLLFEVDKPQPSVEVRAVIFEVSDTDVRSSGLAALLSLFGGAVTLGNGEAQGQGSFLKLDTGGIEAVVSASRSDSRFKIVAQPTLVARSGTTATLNSGAQVPTLGSVTFTDDGRPIRSVEYRDSGVTLTVSPVVRDGQIELQIEQERSSFAATSSGVDDTPTLNRNSTTSSVNLDSGEMVALASLDVQSNESLRSGFLAGLLGSKRKQNTSSQLIVVVQAVLIDAPASLEPSFSILSETTKALPDNGS